MHTLRHSAGPSHQRGVAARSHSQSVIHCTASPPPPPPPPSLLSLLLTRTRAHSLSVGIRSFNRSFVRSIVQSFVRSFVLLLLFGGALPSSVCWWRCSSITWMDGWGTWEATLRTAAGRGTARRNAVLQTVILDAVAALPVTTHSCNSSSGQQ